MVVDIPKARLLLSELLILVLLFGWNDHDPFSYSIFLPSVAAIAGTLQNNPHQHYSKLLFDDIVMGRCYEYEQNYNAEGLEKSSCATIVRTLRTILDNHQESDEPHVLTDVFHTVFVDGVMNGSYNPYEYYHVSSSAAASSASSSSSSSSSSAAAVSAASSSSSVIVTPTIWMSLYGGTDPKSQNAQRIKTMFRVDEKTDTENHHEDIHQQYYYVTPETTIGGELLEGLVFCAQNPTIGGTAEDNDTTSCSIETSNAYWSYWKAVYTAFTDHVVRHALLRGDATTRMLLVVDDPRIDYDFLRDAVLIHLKATTTTALASKDYIDDYDYDSTNENNGKTKETQQNSLIHLDLWGVHCESSPLVDKIMHYLDEDTENDDEDTDASHSGTAIHGNHHGAISKLPKLSVVCHGPDLVELGLCYNNNKDSSPCRQYQRGKDPTNTMDDRNTNKTIHDDDTSSSDTALSVSASSTKSVTNSHQPGTTEHDRIIDTHNHANFSNMDGYNNTTTTTYFWYHLFSSCMLVLIGYILGVFYGYGYSLRTKIVNVVYCCDKYNNKHNTGARNRRSDFHNSRTNTTIRYGSLEDDSITRTDSSTDDDDNTMNTATDGSCHNNPSVSRHPSFVEPFWVHGSGNNNNNNDPTNNNTSSRTSTNNDSAENTTNIRNNSYQCTRSQ